MFIQQPIPAPPTSATAVVVTADWQVRVSAGTFRVGGRTVRVAQTVIVDVPPATRIEVRDERHDSLPPFNERAAPWTKGARLLKLAAFETSAPDLLLPETLAVKSRKGDASRHSPGKDYALDPRWATIGRLPGGIPEGQPVWLDYTCGLNRIDSIVVDGKGAVSLRAGEPHNATPHRPTPEHGETVLANLWIPGNLAKLKKDNVYPVLEPSYPEPKRVGNPPAARLLPRTWEKLRRGKPVHVLAWGDSVTDGGQASDEAHRYQSRFVALLKKRFPNAELILTTAGWGGRNSDSFLQEPAGSAHNFETAVLAPHPDLIVMEFVNDAWMTPSAIDEKYGYLERRFREAGAEWIILTPHYVRPDWMGADTVRVEADPRPYVAGLREFAAKRHAALADASLRWGHLLKEGIPYITLLSNCINHPDDRGHELFAKALMELFR